MVVKKELGRDDVKGVYKVDGYYVHVDPISGQETVIYM